MNPDRHPCPCCGYRTFAAPAGGTWDICPVCFWEDSGDFHRYACRQPIAEAQRTYLATGAVETEFQNLVRAPLPEEARSPFWLCADGMKSGIIGFIEEAFADVCLGEGITLRQQQVIDDWGSSEAVLAARTCGSNDRWQDIPTSTLENHFHHTLIYLDPASVRYHLPAFMRFFLQCFEPDEWGDDMLLYSLEEGPEPDGCHAGAFSLLDPPQHQAVAAFLSFIEKYSDRNSETALKGLERGWNAHIPDFIRLAGL